MAGYTSKKAGKYLVKANKASKKTAGHFGKKGGSSDVKKIAGMGYSKK